MDIASRRKIFTGAVLALAVAIPATFWLKEGWYHFELFRVPESVWSPARNGSWERQLATTLYDWTVFDINTHRLRPLSDLVEVIDAMMRPLRLFGTHPSLSLCAILLAMSTAAAFYRAIRESGQDRLESACYTLLLVTTIGYLSCFVPYIRPAKKLALLFCSLMLLGCSRYRGTRRSLALVWFSVFFGFFSDEAGFIFWPIACAFVGPIVVAERRWKGLVALAGLPLAYAATAKLAVPALYALVGTPRLMQMGVMGNLLSNLASLKFYLVAGRDLATGLLATVGIVGAPHWIGDFALIAIGGAAGVTLGRRQWWRFSAVAAPVMASFGLTLFDWYNTPFASNAFGALTFYYHSPVALLIAFAVAQFGLPVRVLIPVVVAVVALNLTAFGNINRIAMIMHTYPLEARALPREVEEPDALGAEFRSRVSRLDPREGAWFERTFAYYKLHPMGGPNFVRRFNKIYHPDGFNKHLPPLVGGLELDVRFPLDRPGQAEPLITTGVPGAGDFIYVVYLDQQHIELGFDHWGIDGSLSAPIPVDYRSVHHLRINLGDLFAGNGEGGRRVLSSAELAAQKDRISIEFDHRSVFDVEAESYPAGRDTISVGRNQIGGSTTGPKFTGQIVGFRRPEDSGPR